MLPFRYHPDIIRDFPNVVGGIISAGGLVNPPSDDALRALYAAEQDAVRARIGETPLSEIASLSAWRAAFSKFGVSPTQYRSAAESLLRRLTKKGDIPSINTLVDIGNLVSIRYGLPVAVLDTRQIADGITVQYASGSETFLDLADDADKTPHPGEVVFVDSGNNAVARRWCWRQSATSAAVETTRDVLITVEAHHAGGRAAVEAAVADLLALLPQFAGGMGTAVILDAAHPSTPG